MAITVDTVQLRFKIKPDYNQQQIQQLQSDLKQSQKNIEAERKEMDKYSRTLNETRVKLREAIEERDKLAKQKTKTTEEMQHLGELNQTIEKYEDQITDAKNAIHDHGVELDKNIRVMVSCEEKLKDYTTTMNIHKMSIAQLGERQKELNRLVGALNPQTDDWKQYKAELDGVKKRIAELRREELQLHDEEELQSLTLNELSERQKALNVVLRDCDPKDDDFKKYSMALKETEDRMSELQGTAKETENALLKFADNANKIGFFITNALAIKDRIVNWADQYVQLFAKMDDAMTDVMKYTGQTKREVEDMNETFKGMTTRTPREELNALAGSAGRLGIHGRKDIEGFVDAADKINVALGDDLGEGAIDQIGKLTMVFGEDKTKGLNGAMLATGSAINVLGANSSANTGFITEFTSDMAGMAVNAHIAQTDIMGYASALSQAGVEGKTASGVFAQLITKMFTDPARFAKAAKLDVKAFTDLLKTDANAAIIQFLEGLKQNGGFDALAPALKSLKMQGTQAVPVISSLINKMDELKKAQKDARQAYDEGTSIIEEFNNANSSAAAKLEIKKKALNDEAVALGQKLMPIVEGSITAGTTSLKIISSLITFTYEHRTSLIALAITVGVLTAMWKAHAIQQAIVDGLNKALVIGNKALTASMWLLRSAGVALHATWALLTKGVEGYTVVMRAARLASLTNPFAALATVLTVVGVAIYGVVKAWNAHKRALQEQDPAWRAAKAHIKDMQDINKRMNNETAKEIASIHQLTNVIRSNAFSVDERRAAIKRLQEIVPDYHASIDKEGQLIESNTNKLTEYIQNLQKAARAQAYMDKLAEIENEKLDNDLLLNRKQNNLKLVDAELNRGKNTTYKSQKATVSYGDSGTEVEIETNSRLTEKLKEREKQQNAVNAALKTQEELTRRQKELTDQMAKDGIMQEFVIGGNKTTSTTPTTPTSGDGSGSGTSKKEQAERDRQRKELEAQAKAAYEREKLELRQQYEGKKHLQDEWHQKQYTAETRYLAKIGSLRDEYNADESEKMEAKNQLLDAIIREANYQEEARKRNLQESLRNIDQYQAEDEMRLIRQQLDGEIKTQEEFNQKKLELEIKWQKERLQYLQKGSQEYLSAQKQLLSMELQQLQQNEKEKEQLISSYQNTNNGILGDQLTQESTFSARLALLEDFHNAALISEEQYQQRLTEIQQEQVEARQDIEQAAVELFNQGIAAAQQLFQAAQQRETSAVDAKYKKLIAAAKKQGKDTTKLEEQQEAEKMTIKKKYAQKEFQLKVLQIVSSTAMAIADVWSKWAGTPYVAAALTALAVATGAIQLASAKAAADQAAGLYEGGYSDDYQEGYTKKGNPRDQAGVIPVHKNEFVANHKAVANPEVKPVLDVIDRHQKAGDIQMLNSTRMLEEAYGRGRYRGGYVQGGSDSDYDEGDNPQSSKSDNSEAMQLLRRIADRMEKALTIREVRDEIRHQESLEARARR